MIFHWKKGNFGRNLPKKKGKFAKIRWFPWKKGDLAWFGQNISLEKRAILGEICEKKGQIC